MACRAQPTRIHHDKKPRQHYRQLAQTRIALLGFHTVCLFFVFITRLFHFIVACLAFGAVVLPFPELLLFHPGRTNISNAEYRDYKAGSTNKISHIFSSLQNRKPKLMALTLPRQLTTRDSNLFHGACKHLLFRIHLSQHT